MGHERNEVHDSDANQQRFHKCRLILINSSDEQFILQDMTEITEQKLSMHHKVYL